MRAGMWVSILDSIRQWMSKRSSLFDLVEALVDRVFRAKKLASQLIDSTENDDLVWGGRYSGRLIGVGLAADGNAAKRSRTQ